MATKLIDTHHEAKLRRLAELNAELAELEADLIFTPEEPASLDTVVRFRKFDRQYTYAAIKVGYEWYLTQNPERPQDRRPPKTWSELLTFIGERNFDTIEVLA